MILLLLIKFLKKVIKKRTLLKNIGPETEATEIVTVEEDDKQPQHTVTVKKYLEKPKKIKKVKKPKQTSQEEQKKGQYQ